VLQGFLSAMRRVSFCSVPFARFHRYIHRFIATSFAVLSSLHSPPPSPFFHLSLPALRKTRTCP
jgi:hypothetical protein